MRPTSTVLSAASLEIRALRFEEVAEILRLIRRAVDEGCRHHYDLRQRAAVYASYASHLFLEALGPFDTFAAEHQGRIVGVAQLDAADARLRALFVDAGLQRRGVGRGLLAHAEARAASRGCVRLHGAMSLNAVPFYLQAGFRPSPGPELLASAGIPVPILRMEKPLPPARG